MRCFFSVFLVDFTTNWELPHGRFDPSEELWSRTTVRRPAEGLSVSMPTNQPMIWNVPSGKDEGPGSFVWFPIKTWPVLHAPKIYYFHLSRLTYPQQNGVYFLNYSTRLQRSKLQLAPHPDFLSPERNAQPSITCGTSAISQDAADPKPCRLAKNVWVISLEDHWRISPTNFWGKNWILLRNSWDVTKKYVFRGIICWKKMEDSSVFSIQSLARSCRAVTLGKHPPCSLEVGRSYQKKDGRFVVLFSFGAYQYVCVCDITPQ